MPTLKLLLASDLHYCQNLQAEIKANHNLLPADTYDHQQNGRLFWHNEMLVERMGDMLEALLELAEQEKPDQVIFLGDLVNTNWSENVAFVAEKLKQFACPVNLITGNHDIYLSAPECRLQAQLRPDEFETGLRSQFIDNIGLIFLDLFVHYPNGDYRKWLAVDEEKVQVDYRPEDVQAALALMKANPDKQFLIFGHFPMTSPEDRILQPGRRIGRRWAGGASLAERLQQPNNLIGILTGHQHFAHLQLFEHGFHWTLPALVEYPCAAAILTIDEQYITGRLVQPAPTLTDASLQSLNQNWTAGQVQDQQLHWPG